MTALVSLLCITTIPIDCKVTNLSLYLFVNFLVTIIVLEGKNNRNFLIVFFFESFQLSAYLYVRPLAAWILLNNC